MKKLFSIVLMGAALFVSTNANAIVVNDAAALRAAINTPNAIVQLGGANENFVLDTMMFVSLNGSVTLDLNGHNLVYAYDPEVYKGSGDTKRQQGRMINLQKGTLTVTNSQPASGGWVKNETEGNSGWSYTYYASKTATTLSGGTEIVVFSVTGDSIPTSADYSVLNIEPEVKVSAPDGKVGIIVNAVTVKATKPYAEFNYVARDKKGKPYMAKATLNIGCSYGVVVNMKGYTYGNKYGIQISGNNSAAPKLGVGYNYTDIPDVDLSNETAVANFIAAATAVDTVWTSDVPAKVKDCGCGQSYHSSKRCNWKWLGDFETTGSETLKDANFPEVNIAKTGECASKVETIENGNGFYAGGYSVSTIEGYCHGSNGVYVKAGDITLSNAVISSENPNYTEIKQGTREGAGNALVLESLCGYPGEAHITIVGDTKLEAISGYAIEDQVTTAATSTKSIEIQGGTFVGGEEGGMATHAETEVDIINGNFKDVDVSEYVKPGDNYTLTTADGTVVVCTGTEPSWQAADLVDKGGDYKWNDATKTQEISSNIEVDFFDLEAGKVIVKDGATLSVDRLIMGSTNAEIIVEAGGRLVVEGDMGIVANTVGNITIEAQEGNMGEFLFNPIVSSNRHPKATIHFISKAYGNDASDNLRQIFGNPMQAKTMQEIVSNNHSYWSRFDRDVYGDWDYIGTLDYPGASMAYDKFDKEFAFYCITSNNPGSVTMEYDMTGNLLGNTQPEDFKIFRGWTAASNSWTGNVSAMAMLDELTTLGADQNVYTYEQQGNALIWHSHGKKLNKIYDIEPLQPLYINNESNKEIAYDIMNYENLVWNYAFPDPSAPARQEAEENFVQARIRIANAKGISDYATVAEVETSNAVKFPNEVISVYAMANREYDILAAENIDNTFIGFNGKEAGKYTVSFENVNGNMVLVDLVNNKQVAMVEGAKYEFEAKANEANPYRFQVRKIAEQATAVENVEAEAKADGVYTITGQFIGTKSMLNNLPAGVYVVDGKKIVK